jgi:hypothetical protein
MSPQSDDKERWRLEDEVHQRLMEARTLYQENKTSETRAAYLQALRAFTDVVIFGLRPKKEP